MNHLIEQGKILYWGTSEWSAQEITEAHMVAREHHLIGPVMEQPQYNLFHREKVENEYAQLYKTLGLGTTIWSPLGSGVLTGKYLEKFPEGTRLGMEGLEWLKERSMDEEKLVKVRSLKQLADELNVSLPRLAIAWCLKNPQVSTVILGASRPEQLEETLTSLDVVDHLTTEVLERIEKIVDNKPVPPAF